MIARIQGGKKGRTNLTQKREKRDKPDGFYLFVSIEREKLPIESVEKKKSLLSQPPCAFPYGGGKKNHPKKNGGKLAEDFSTLPLRGAGNHVQEKGKIQTAQRLKGKRERSPCFAAVFPSSTRWSGGKEEGNRNFKGIVAGIYSLRSPELSEEKERDNRGVVAASCTTAFKFAGEKGGKKTTV